MEKRKHHFVPVFYLKLFASEPRRIHLYNIERNAPIRNAALRDQCYRHRFHGRTNEVEDALSAIEAEFAPVIQKIILRSELPKAGSEDRNLLTFFVAFQMLRTAREAEKTNLRVDKMTKHVFGMDARFKDTDWDSFRFGYEHPVLFPLSQASLLAWCISDLHYNLVCSEKSQIFVTSDSPVFKYNQFYESYNDSNMAGGVSRGLQLFIPLSPHHLLFIYDKSVYSVKKCENNIIRLLTDSDIQQLNTMQATIAHQNIYFNDWGTKDSIRGFAMKSKKYRQQYGYQLDEFSEVGDEGENDLLLRSYERIPNLQLKLSFIGLTKYAKQRSRKQQFAPEYRFRKQVPDSGIEAEGLAHKYHKRKIFRRK
jgi:hypothetical protein